MADNNGEIIEQLRITNRLLTQLLIKDLSTQTEKVNFLSQTGFTPTNIANILNMSINSVTGITYKSRNKEKSPKKGRQHE